MSAILKVGSPAKAAIKFSIFYYLFWYLPRRGRLSSALQLLTFNKYLVRKIYLLYYGILMQYTSLFPSFNHDFQLEKIIISVGIHSKKATRNDK